MSDFYTIRSAIEKKISGGSKEKDIIGQLQMYLAFWQICSWWLHVNPNYLSGINTHINISEYIKE